MNKKLRSGPRIRQTRPALHRLKSDSHLLCHTCKFCGLKFTQNSQYFRHMNANHVSQQKTQTFQCNECLLVFTKKAYLDLHCQSHHKAKKKSRCDSCAVTFKSRYCLRRHKSLKKTLSENACVKCQKKFIDKDLLAKHMKNKHTFAHTTFQCKYCDLKFKMLDSLAAHLHRIHKL